MGRIPYSLNINLGLQHWFNTFCALRPAEKLPSTCRDFYFFPIPVISSQSPLSLSTPSVQTMLRHMQYILFFWYPKCSPSHNKPRLMADYHTIMLWFWARFIEYLGRDINAFSFLIFKPLTRLIIARCIFPVSIHRRFI